MLRDLEGRGLAPNTRRLARPYCAASGPPSGRAWCRATSRRSHRGSAERSRRPHADTDDARRSLTSIEGHQLEAAWAVALGLGLAAASCSACRGMTSTPTPRHLVSRSAGRCKGFSITGWSFKTRRPPSRDPRQYLPAPTAGILGAYRERSASDRAAAGDRWESRPLGLNLVFRKALGTAIDPDDFSNATVQVTAYAGLGSWSPRELRHSTASLVLAQGVDLKVSARRWGPAQS
jgi:integrase